MPTPTPFEGPPARRANRSPLPGPPEHQLESLPTPPPGPGIRDRQVGGGPRVALCKRAVPNAADEPPKPGRRSVEWWAFPCTASPAPWAITTSLLPGQRSEWTRELAPATAFQGATFPNLSQKKNPPGPREKGAGTPPQRPLRRNGGSPERRAPTKPKGPVWGLQEF
ncbi:hypothetical protein TNIN_320521 [Trichonephila inaurata madagascariensis]|uniref:Uncharacterized protein n=1 Tax=Trichonephila inaurata madagascariensis TaxID=2747483 RepID=A0A8X6Y2P8_9ARAC|nr:hypothetical protein TNIN_320521 [Trichonephila inaurata madagascariensis]